MEDFEAFVGREEPRLRAALVAARGPVDGRDATAEALSYAWEHWERISAMTNPAGYLFRVGQSRSRPRKSPQLAPAGVTHQPEVEPELAMALRALSEPQRVAVFLVHGCGWGHAEVGEVLEVSPSTVSTHVQRGMAKLRKRLEVSVDA